MFFRFDSTTCFTGLFCKSQRPSLFRSWMQNFAFQHLKSEGLWPLQNRSVKHVLGSSLKNMYYRNHLCDSCQIGGPNSSHGTPFQPNEMCMKINLINWLIYWLIDWLFSLVIVLIVLQILTGYKNRKSFLSYFSFDSFYPKD